jgi:hypothetical protein
MRLRFRFAVAVAAVLSVSTFVPPAGAANLALLVGVSRYPEARHRLDGPPNDVALIRQVLLERGFAGSDIRVLADAVDPKDVGFAPDGAPTRAAILGELGALAKRAQRGDFVFLLFSGHGSQQPAAADTGGGPGEADGLDEIFLPADIGRWESATSKVENAIVDNELGGFVRALQQRGALVWVVVDACHSGTMTRGVDDEVRFKRLSPEALGVPADLLQRARAASVVATRSTAAPGEAEAPWDAGGSGEGGLVAFFAAQASEVAIERPLPRAYDAPDRRQRSLLSYYLAQALISRPGATYRELAQHILAGYDKEPRAPTPLFEGDLDRSAFGAAGAAAAFYPVRHTDGGALEMATGRLRGVTEGSTVELWPLAGDTAQPLAVARAAKVGLNTAIVEPEGIKAAALPERLHARLAARAVPFGLVVARPYPAADGETARVEAGLDALAGTPSDAARLALTLVPPDAAADVYLRVGGGRIWLLPSTGEWVREGRGRTPSLPLAATAEEVARDLERHLRGLATGRNLLLIAAELGSGALAGKLQVEAFLLRDPAPEAAPAAATPVDARPCPPVARRSVPAEAVPFRLEATPELYHCDAVYLRVRNAGTLPIDLTALFLDAEGTLHAVGKTRGGLRLDPGGSELLTFQITTWDLRANAPSTIGLERLLLIGVERREKDIAFVTSFDYLAEPSWEAAGTRSAAAGAAGALRSLLEGAAFGSGRIRSAAVSGGSDFADAAIPVLRWNVKPPVVE